MAYGISPIRATARPEQYHRAVMMAFGLVEAQSSKSLSKASPLFRAHRIKARCAVQQI